MSTFHIQYHQQDIKVTEQGENHFTVELPERPLRLQLKQDSDGANHWLEEDKEHETEQTKAVGLAIEMYWSSVR
jgi:hypothetical protein